MRAWGRTGRRRIERLVRFETGTNHFYRSPNTSVVEHFTQKDTMLVLGIDELEYIAYWILLEPVVPHNRHREKTATIVFK